MEKVIGCRKERSCQHTFLCALQLRARSEDDADDELLSVAIVKNGNKAVTGSGTGVLSLYSWGYFNDCSDRFPGLLTVPFHVSAVPLFS